MKLKVNGKLKEYPDNVTIFDVFQKEEIIEPIAVELVLNGKIVNYSDFENISLKDNDEIELIYLFASG